VELESIMLSEISQVWKHKSQVCSYMQNLDVLKDMKEERGLFGKNKRTNGRGEGTRESNGG
jgi:hypothetical protein